MNIFSSITHTSWTQEAITFIPITEFDFNKEQINLNESLDHGFSDLDAFFPSWNIFLRRSYRQEPNYPNYMKFLMNHLHLNKIISLLNLNQEKYNINQKKEFITERRDYSCA